MYKKRAIPDLLHRAKLFASLPDAERAAIVSFLQPRVDLIRVDPGQIVFEQGQVADHFYLVRQGFVKVARKAGKDEIVLDYLGPQTQFGEIGLLTADTVNYLDNDEKAALPLGFLNGTRSATVSALDEVEVVQITGEDFYYMAQQYPTFKKRVIEQAKEYLEKNQRNLSTIGVESLSEATEKGIFNANNLLVIDLEKCTRCDECSKACADNHGGVSRLKRDGMRYGHYLVTTTCRSCQNPYCMAGCPVDAIHRKPSLDGREGQEIVIEAWCIGCGRCEQNCPYGNISMQDYIVLESGQPGEDGNKAPVRLQSYRPNLKARIKLATLKVLSRFSSRFKVTRKARKRAVTCDLCRDVCHKKGQEVACVHACPHDAAHRLSGPKLIDLVRERSTI
jgi:Fe-S-cluster-containing hydrogenase component 2/CRP-like cAMP-binding protein